MKQRPVSKKLTDRVLAVLGEQAAEHGGAAPGALWMAEQIGISRPQVNEVYRRLKARGHLKEPWGVRRGFVFCAEVAEGDRGE